MRRSELEHVIRAAGSIADTKELIILGSQAILGSFPNPPPELTVSQEVDTYPPENPEKADLIDGSIGEKSLFHETFGYYAHGVGPETAVLPAKWKRRLVRLQNRNTRGVTGLCLSPEDLAISKLAAGRTKDYEFVRALFRHKLISFEKVSGLLKELEDSVAARIRPRLLRYSKV